MRPEQRSTTLLGVARSKAKMFEYGIPEKDHIKITQDPASLFALSIGILGDTAGGTNRKDIEPEVLDELRRDLTFSAYFFDAYLRSRLSKSLDNYLILIGSASYYLCDLPGSSSVLAKEITHDCPDLDSAGLQELLLWLLQGDLSTYFEGSQGLFGQYIDSISDLLCRFYSDGTGETDLLNVADRLCDTAYESMVPRYLLLADVTAAIVRKKCANSSWHSLPLYSGLSRDRWVDVLKKESFIKEFWPAQHLIGKALILQGKSAVVQMPTSAGKTKAIELIIRSAFLAGRIALAVIVAPFRALCHEIKNSLVSAFKNEAIKIDELSDVLQTDFEIAEFLKDKQILVVTPEKLLYVLRYAPELGASVGLAIFDEGHQFDSGSRGIAYELLLTSLRSMLPESAQKVLISAVISNAEAVGEWLNGTESAIVAGTNLVPTLRSVGFASWIDQLGRIEYVSSGDVERREFFVPRVIESFKLQKRNRESKQRLFPDRSKERDVGKQVALYLGLKLMVNGAVAIFCGTKVTASGLCEMIVDAFSRNLPLPKPTACSDEKEITKLHYLYSWNLGSDAPASKAAELGIFSHHGNTPQGIRLSVEHAMRENLICYVVCTSTLAQGVNLPIRYLIVTSIYQGAEQIKVRDFHNLIGRAGRAGMHTEGSVLFADPVVYDKRMQWREKWRWARVKELLDPSKSEECISSLFRLIPLKIFNDRSKSQDKKEHILTWDILSFARAYVSGRDELMKNVKTIVKKYGKNGFTEEKTNSQFESFVETLASVESFLLSNWDTAAQETNEEAVARLAEETLAYFLSDEKKRQTIRELFELLAKNILQNVEVPELRKVYGRTLYGVGEAKEIRDWVETHIDRLSPESSDAEMLDLLWPLLAQHLHGSFNKCDKPLALLDLAKKWVQGTPFYQLLSDLKKADAKLIWGTKRRDFKIDHIVDMCEAGLSYEGALLVGSLTEFIELLKGQDAAGLVAHIRSFQKRLRYGLPNEATVILYELGFSDRVIALDLVPLLPSTTQQRKDAIKALRRKKTEAQATIEKYPSYFQDRLNEILSSKRPS